MSKAKEVAEKKGESHTAGHEKAHAGPHGGAHPAEAHKEGHKEGHPENRKEGHDGHKGGHPEGHKEAPARKGKGHEPVIDGCHAWSCKSKAIRFNFCNEHYEHFKFGLIKKTGEPVPDYEKKIDHFQAFKARKSIQKVA